MKAYEIIDKEGNKSIGVLQYFEKDESYVIELMSNLDDCVILDDFSLLCFFKNGAVKKVLLKRLTDVDGVARILENESLYRSGRLSAGGYAVTFNNSIDIPAGILYEAGITIPLSTDDFKKYVQKNVLDTSECCDLLSCTRQNLAYMVSQKQLTPIKEDVKGNLYLKGNVISKSVE